MQPKWGDGEEPSMMANQFETIDAGWDDEQDGAFFRLVADVFPAEFVYSAGVLLATYDDDVLPSLNACSV